MVRRLLQRLQQRVEAVAGEHVDLVNEVDPEPAPGRRVLDVVQQFPHIFHAGLGGGVDFDQIHKPAVLDLAAAVAFAAGTGADPALAAQAPRQDTADRGFAHAPRAGEQKCLMQPVLIQPVHERPEHVLLTNKILKPGRAPFTRKYLIRHAGPSII